MSLVAYEFYSMNVRIKQVIVNRVSISINDSGLLKRCLVERLR